MSKFVAVGPGHSAMVTPVPRSSSASDSVNEAHRARRVINCHAGTGLEGHRRRNVEVSSPAALDDAGEQEPREVGEAGDVDLQHLQPPAERSSADSPCAPNPALLTYTAT